MKVWRISNYVDLEGKGGLFAAGRWHNKGRRIIYTSEHPALATIEFLVTVGDRTLIPAGTVMYSIELPTDLPIAHLGAGLPTDWHTNISRTRALGTQWLESGATLVAQVPSAAAVGTNYLVNPEHLDAALLSIVDRINPPFDTRLLTLK